MQTRHPNMKETIADRPRFVFELYLILWGWGSLRERLQAGTFRLPGVQLKGEGAEVPLPLPE